MARQTKKADVKKFSIDDSPVIAENERILGAQTVPETRPEPIPQREDTPQAQSTPREVSALPRQAKGTEKGITVYVPMDYYKRIRDIKDETGIPIKDLAQRAVMQFVENYKFGE